MSVKPVILVVDDDPPIILLMRSLLREFGFEPLTARDGSEAVASARTRRPDLVLLDKNMPGMSTAETCRALRAELDQVPILIVSGEPLSPDELAHFGADAAVPKPFDISALIERIRGYTTGSEPVSR